MAGQPHDAEASHPASSALADPDIVSPPVARLPEVSAVGVGVDALDGTEAADDRFEVGATLSDEVSAAVDPELGVAAAKETWIDASGTACP
jgi:hypothetical protein